MPAALRPRRLVVPVACYAVILGLSSVPGSQYEQLQLPAALSYAAHAVEYGALGATLCWALQELRWPVAAAGILALVGGVGDEWLQSTVPGRDPAALDLAVDVVAATVAAVIVARVLGRR